MAADRKNSLAHPRIDLATVRETLAYISDDMTTVPALAGVRRALVEAIEEIRTLETVSGEGQGSNQTQSKASNVTFLPAMHFEQWRPRG